MTPDPLRSATQLALSLALSVAIFALPWWSLSQPVDIDVATSAPADNSADRIAVWQPLPEVSVPVDIAPESVAESDPEPPSELTPEPASPPERASPIRVAASPPPPTPLPALAAEPAKPRTVASKKSRRKRRHRNCHPDIPEIETTKAGHWQVERGLVDHYARDLKAAEDLAWVAWARDDDDKVIGFRVVKVRCGSPLWEAGFQHGDVITRINGHKVRTVPQALAAYVALRIKRKLRVRGTRKDGTPIDHRYRLT